jgi:hypothetical protein
METINIEKLLNWKKQIDKTYTYKEALQLLREGKKVKLPEWTGYWFQDTEGIKVLTKKGEIVLTPHHDKHKHRTDWEITEGRMGFDFAILAIKNGKRVCRAVWSHGVPSDPRQMPRWIRMYNCYYDTEFPISEAAPAIGTWSEFIVMNTHSNSLFPWEPTGDDLFATDWQIAEVDQYGRTQDA